jgi:putative ABC transport system permease protein
MYPERWLDIARLRLRSLFRRAAVESELKRELRAHLAHETEASRNSKFSPHESQFTALRHLGGAAQIQEQCRDMRRTNHIENVLRDLKYALRSFGKTPGFALMVTLTLALGIGANTTIFSVMNATLLQPLPFPHADRLALIWETFGPGPDNTNIVSAPNFWDFQRLSQSFSSMAIFDSSGRGYNLGPAGNSKQAEQVSGLRVTASFFTVLEAQPFLGRAFLPEEEKRGNDREVILTYGLWKRRYGGDPSIIGRSIRVDSADFTVVGVMPQQFRWQFWSNERQLFVPIGYTKTDYGRGDNSFLCIGRLKPGVTIPQSQAELASIAKNVAAQYPKDDANMGATALPIADYGLQWLRIILLTLLAAVGFVLLIACVNVANLLLARGASRQKEFAIRLALGAPAGRIARQLLTENLLLALAGGAAGLLFATILTRVLFLTFHLDTLYLPMRPVDAIHTDSRVYIFALAVSCVTGLLFGIVPAFSALRANVNDPLKEGGRGQSSARSHLRHALVACEVALALVILSGAGLMIKSMSRLLGVDPGFKPHNVLNMVMSVPQEEIYVGPPDLPRFCQDLSDRIGAIPGVLAVGAVGHLPLRGNAGRSFQVEGKPPATPGNMPGASYSVACPGYFRAMAIPMIKGREFTNNETLHSPGVIVVNESMARLYWPKEDAIGKAIRFGGSNGPRLTIIGVAGDVHFQGLDSPARPQFFRPYTQAGWPIMNVVVRTASFPLSFETPIRKSLAEIMPDLPVSEVDTLENILKSSTGARRFPMLLLSAFSVLALVLAAIGIAGVVGHSVVQRTNEIGIRMALGAGSVDVLRLMINANMLWVLAGLLAGLAGSLALTRLLTRMLYEVRPLDPAVLGGVSAVLAAVALAATYFPARRAARIDPIAALRNQ